MPIPVSACPTCGQPNWPKDVPESLNVGEIADGRELSARLLSVARALINQPISTFGVGPQQVEFVRVDDIGPFALALVRLGPSGRAKPSRSRGRRPGGR